MNHTLTAKGAAFVRVEGDLGVVRVDETGTGGVGSALCNCGWLSTELPSGKQRVVAHKVHRVEAEVAEMAAEDEAQDGEETPNLKAQPSEELLAALEEEKAEDEDLIGETDEEQDGYVIHQAHRDFPGNYSIVMAPFAVGMANAVGVTSEVETFKGKLNRRVHFASDAPLDDFLEVLDRETSDALEDLHKWQKEHAAERKGKTDMVKFLEHRAFLTKFGEEAADRLRQS